MLIESTSKYYLKRIRAKAKLYEYHIPDELHGNIEEEVNRLIISAIGIIGDFSDAVINSFNGVEFSYEDFRDEINFAAKFFDGYVDSKLCLQDEEYFLLLGAIVYYLGNRNGSAHVLISRIDKTIDLGVGGLDTVIMQVLMGAKKVEYTGPHSLVMELVEEFNYFIENGVFSGYDKMSKLKEIVYECGSDRELLFSDALIAIIYLKIQYSAYHLMPHYTGIEFDVWKNAIVKDTLVKELWQSQRELGDNGVFAGKSATIQMPTSSGKTKSIALIILSAFFSNRTNKAIVVAPFRALCREISDELAKAFSFSDKIYVNELSDVLQMDLLEMLLGSKNDMAEQSVYVVTPEKLLFVLRQDIRFLSQVGLIVFDEGHLFDDYNRGITYEMLISTIKLYVGEETQKILISAVIPNAEEINGWLTGNKGVVIKNNVIQTTEKSVSIAEWLQDKKTKSLYAYLYFLNPENPDEEEFFVPRVIAQTNISKLGKEKKERLFPEINTGSNKNDMAIALGINLCTNGGVAIFCGRKDTADNILSRVLNIDKRGYDVSNIPENSDEQERSRIANLIALHLGKDNDYYHAAQIGAFVHHGGIPMGIRCSVEHAMQKGLIRFLACTSTLAQGVNLPIRYLIVPTVYQGKERIKVRDFQNLIGRAGRAGIYTEGNIILSETMVYRNRRDSYLNWKWRNYKELLNSNQAEACTSELLSWLRVDDGLERYMEGILEIFENTYATGTFTKEVMSFLEEFKFEQEESYLKAELIVTRMTHNIESIESFLLFYLMENTYDESKDIIHSIIEETLAYYLANDTERARLLHMVDLIGSFIVKSVDTPDKRLRYSKSLLGVRKEIEIEEWVKDHVDEISQCNSEGELLEEIFSLLLQTNNSLVKACSNPAELIDLGKMWIAGYSYESIRNCAAEEKHICIYKRGHNNPITINQVIELCDSFFSYDCMLLIAAIIENIEYFCEDDSLNDIIRSLSKRMRYGLSNQCSITLYEMGFNDRVIASYMADIIEREYKTGSRREIRKILRMDKGIRESVLMFLEDYPSYFMDKVKTILKL